MSRMTMRNVKDALALHSVSIRKEDGEYRVSLMELRGTSKEEAVAYYTDDLEDALLTGLAMRRHADGSITLAGKAELMQDFAKVT